MNYSTTKKIVLKRLALFAKTTQLLIYYDGSLSSIWLINQILLHTNHQLLVLYFPQQLSIESKEPFYSLSSEKILDSFSSVFPQLTCLALEGKFSLSAIELNIQHCLKNKSPLTYLIKDLDWGEDQICNVLSRQESYKNIFSLVDTISIFSKLDSRSFYFDLLTDLKSQESCIPYQFISRQLSFYLETYKQNNSFKEIFIHDYDLDLLFIFLINKKSLKECEDFVLYHGSKISKSVYIYIFNHGLISFHSAREKLIMLCVRQGNLTDEQLNLFFLEKCKLISSQSDDFKFQEIDYIFRLYSYKISQQSKDEALISAFNYLNNYPEKLFKLLISQGADVGECLIYVIHHWKKEARVSAVKELLEKYLHSISQIQLNEALITASQLNFSDCCDLLIHAGANPQVTRYHFKSYATELLIKKHDLMFRKSNNNATYSRSKDRIIVQALLKELKHPEKKLKNVIHITGSNGKGSTGAFLSQLLYSQGISHNRLSSPPCFRGNDDIYLNEQEVSDEAYYDALSSVAEAYKVLCKKKSFQKAINKANKEDNLSEEEIQNDHLAFSSLDIPAIILLFSKHPADYNIIEVITGGEFDLTNVFDEKNTVATVITSIIFGDLHKDISHFRSIENAARTKTGLSKPGIPIFTASQENKVLEIMKNIAQSKGSALFQASQDWFITKKDNSFYFDGFSQNFTFNQPMLVGSYQQENAALALAVLSYLRCLETHPEAISKAIESTRILSRLSYIDQDMYPLQSKKLILGTCKSKWAFEDFFKLYPSKEINLVVEGYDYVDEKIGYLKRLNPKNFANLIYVHRHNDDLIAEELKDRGWQIKKYHSSAIHEINKTPSEYLVVLTFGIVAFSVQLIQLFNYYQQDHYQADLKFAKKHRLLEGAQNSQKKKKRTSKKKLKKSSSSMPTLLKKNIKTQSMLIKTKK